MVDVTDFNEQLQQTSFPDLLEGVPGAPPQERRRKRKNKKKLKVKNDPAGDLLDTLLEEQEEEDVIQRNIILPESGQKKDFLDAVSVSPLSNSSPTAVNADLRGDRNTKNASASLTAAGKVCSHLDIPDLSNDDEFTKHNELDQLERGAGDSSDEEKSCSDVEEEEEDATALLKRASDRVARQELQERVVELESELAKKQTEIQTLHGQLRMATATKCDLVVAHKELEQTHETAVAAKNENLVKMKQANQFLLELQAQTDFELLNELIRVTDMFHGIQRKHKEELDDWERMHRNEMLEKDYEIARLVEELRQAGLRPSRSNDHKML